MFGLNWVDFVIAVGLLIAVITGLTQGLLRQIIVLASVYVGAILATQYYSPAARFLKGNLATTPGTVLQALTFFFILFVTSLIINGLAYDAYRNTKIHLFPVLDSVGGAVVALFTAWLLFSLLLLPANYAVTTDAWGSYDWVRQSIEVGIRDSYLARLFQSMLPYVIAAIRPWLPAGVTTIFNL